MSWEERRAISPMVTQDKPSGFDDLLEENKKLREECEYLKTRLASSGVRAFSNGVACCGVFFGFVLVSAISCYLLMKGFLR